MDTPARSPFAGGLAAAGRGPAPGPACLSRWPTALALALAVALPPLSFHLHGDIGLNPADEGFLWYGAQRVLAGEVPLRDFQAYDIGRYYWSAAWMWLWGSTGILPVRAGNAVLAACTVVIAVRLVDTGDRRQALRPLLAALTFAAWMVPLYKIADSFAALLLVLGLARLLERPGPRRAFEFGACLGVAATIGINHALYGVAGAGLAAARLAWAAQRLPGPRPFVALGLGAALGYAPVLAFLLAVPGFAAAFADSIRLLFESGTTNLALPLPRASAVLRPDWRWAGAAQRESVMGALFVAAPVFVWLGLRRLPARGGSAGEAPPAAFAASLFLSLPYAHYAWSRADVVHVAISILPLLVAAWTFPAGRRRAAHAAGLLALALGSAFLVFPQHPAYSLARGDPLERVVVRGETLRVGPRTARELELLQRLTQLAPADAPAFYAAPYWTTAYAATGRRSPAWEIYPLFPSTDERQRREIRRLVDARVGIAAISTLSVDRRADLGLRRTHPAIVSHIRRCMTKLELPGNAVPDIEVFIDRGVPCPSE